MLKRNMFLFSALLKKVEYNKYVWEEEAKRNFERDKNTKHILEMRRI